MRGSYHTPTVEEFEYLFAPANRGGSLRDIKIYKTPVAYQKGGSLFSFLGKLVRGSIPFLKSIILPEVGNFVSNVASNVNADNNIRQCLKKEGLKSLSNVGKRIINRGGGIRKKSSKSKKKNTKKKKRVCRKKSNKEVKYNDVFSKYNLMES